MIQTKLIFLPQTLLQGDSGGPLTYKSGNQHVQIGVLSGTPCFECSFARVAWYASISYHRQWIEEKMISPKYCGAGPDADAKKNGEDDVAG